MKRITLFLIIGVITASLCSAQTKPTKTDAEIKQVGESIKAIGSLFKKKNKGGTAFRVDSSAKAGPIAPGNDGITFPVSSDKIFNEPGGGVLCADSHGGTVIINGVLYEWGDRTYGQQGSTEAKKNIFTRTGYNR